MVDDISDDERTKINEIQVTVVESTTLDSRLSKHKTRNEIVMARHGPSLGIDALTVRSD
jgi:hypothetical protein